MVPEADKSVVSGAETACAARESALVQGVVVADGQKQQQGPLQRLHLRGHVAGAQPQRQHRGRGGDQLLQHRVGRQKLPDRAAGCDKPPRHGCALRDHAVLHEQDRLGRAVKECMKLFG